MAEKFEGRHYTLAAALDANPATLEERTVYALPLGFAMKEFDKKIEVWRNLEVRLTENGKVTDIQDRVRPDVLRSQAIVMKNLTKEKRTRGAKTPGYMFSKADYLVTLWDGADFITRPTPVNFFVEREKLTRL